MRIFLSFASQDSHQVRALSARLSKDGFDPWLYEDRLTVGSDWKLEIEKALESADAVIVCLSQASTTKIGYVQKEFRHTLELSELRPEGTYYLFPVKLEPCDIPRSMRHRQYVNIFDHDGYTKLVAGLRRHASESNIPLSNSILRYNSIIRANNGISLDRLEKCVTDSGFSSIDTSSLFQFNQQLIMPSFKDNSKFPYIPDLLVDYINECGMFHIFACASGCVLLLVPLTKTIVSPRLRERREILPFVPIYGPDCAWTTAQMTWSATATPLASRILPSPIVVEASHYRPCTLKPESQVLIKSEDGTPILCFKQWGRGYCFFLNAVFDTKYNVDSHDGTEVMTFLRNVFSLIRALPEKNES
jgi:hypothetical protein